MSKNCPESEEKMTRNERIEQAIKTLEPTGGSIDALTAAFTLHKDREGAEDAFNMLWEIGETAVCEAIIKVNGNETQTNELKAKRDRENAKNHAHMEMIIGNIKHLEGVEAEICGKWLWVGGNTRPHANTLKAQGLKFARKKSKWYWRPEGHKRTRRGKSMSMDHIRGKYGSEKVDEN